MKRSLLVLLSILILPVMLAGLFIILVSIQSVYRYDEQYFVSEYKSLYASPGSVAAAAEQVIRTGETELYAELTGLRFPAPLPEINPDVFLMVLLKVNKAGYYQYLFFNVKTYERLIVNVKQVQGRWVLVPKSAYYYLDSGDWLLFFSPFITIWGSLFFVIFLGIGLHRLGSRFRNQLYRYPRDKDRKA